MTREEAILKVKVIKNFINTYSNAGLDVDAKVFEKATELMNVYNITLEDLK